LQFLFIIADKVGHEVVDAQIYQLVGEQVVVQLIWDIMVHL
jgi:hypothetical protein